MKRPPAASQLRRQGCGRGGWLRAEWVCSGRAGCSLALGLPMSLQRSPRHGILRVQAAPSIRGHLGLLHTCHFWGKTGLLTQGAETPEARHSQGQKLRRSALLLTRDPAHMVPVIKCPREGRWHSGCMCLGEPGSLRLLRDALMLKRGWLSPGVSNAAMGEESLAGAGLVGRADLQLGVEAGSSRCERARRYGALCEPQAWAGSREAASTVPGAGCRGTPVLHSIWKYSVIEMLPGSRDSGTEEWGCHVISAHRCFCE